MSIYVESVTCLDRVAEYGPVCMLSILKIFWQVWVLDQQIILTTEMNGFGALSTAVGVSENSHCYYPLCD